MSNTPSELLRAQALAAIKAAPKARPIKLHQFALLACHERSTPDIRRRIKVLMNRWLVWDRAVKLGYRTPTNPRDYEVLDDIGEELETICYELRVIGGY